MNRTEELNERRQALIRFSELQAKLRAILNEVRGPDGNPLNKGDLARKFELDWHEVDRITRKGMPTKSARILAKLSREPAINEIAPEIESLARKIPDRFLGLVGLPENVINLVFDLIRKAGQMDAHANFKAFAARFGPQSRQVYAALSCGREGCKGLDDPETFSAIRMILETTDWSKPVPKADPKQPRTRGSKDSSPELGGTTYRGVRYVLTPESFREIAEDPGEPFAASLKRACEIARALLNAGAQIRDPKTRERLRKEIGPEVEELMTSIRLFTFTHPNRLLESFQQQREFWAATPLPTTTQRRNR